MSEISQVVADAVAEAQAIEAIPAHVYQNIVVMLKRVKLEGDEAVAYVEAMSHLSRFLPKSAQK
jgi:hypothetical protein